MTPVDSRRVSADAWIVNPCVHLAPLQLHIGTNA
jgi:hypothetical protein